METKLSEFYNALLDHRKWVGNRVQLLDLLTSLEALDKKTYGLFKIKSPHAFLPINGRRIQQYIDLELIPKPLGTKYNFEHIAYYFFTIQMRKSGYTLTRLKGLYEAYTIEDVEDRLKDSNLNKKIDKLDIEKDRQYLFPDNLSDRLKELGRPEGRVLKSNLTRLAITPWCHVTINDRNLGDLNPTDCDLLAEAFKKSMLDLIK